MDINTETEHMVRTNLFLTHKEHRAIKLEAIERGITFSEMFRKIVDAYLERKADKERVDKNGKD